MKGRQESREQETQRSATLQFDPSGASQPLFPSSLSLSTWKHPALPPPYSLRQDDAAGGKPSGTIAILFGVSCGLHTYEAFRAVPACGMPTSLSAAPAVHWEARGLQEWERRWSGWRQAGVDFVGGGLGLKLQRPPPPPPPLITPRARRIPQLAPRPPTLLRSFFF